VIIAGTNKIIRSGVVLMVAILAGACTSTAPLKLSPQQRSKIQGRSVVVKQVLPSRFGLISSSAEIAGALDLIAAGANAAKGKSAGDAIVEQDHLVDPVTVIAPALLAEMESVYGVKVIQDSAMTDASLGSAKPPPGTPLMLSVEASSWSTLYLLTRLSHYGIMLEVNAKIIDGVPAKTLREARCIIRPRNQPDAPTFTQLMENDGARLRVEVDYATQACIEDLKQSLIGK
jgi:hypothetical protein